MQVILTYVLLWVTLLCGISKVKGHSHDLNGLTVTTEGASGGLCGRARCLSGIPCVNGRCACSNQGPAPHGKGTFVCSQPDHDLCMVRNDPVIRGFDGSHVELPLFNKVMLSHVISKGCPSAADPSIRCDVKVWTWGERLRGKLFAKGMEVKVFATDGAGNIYNHATRIRADVNSTHFEFHEEGKTSIFGNTEYGAPVTTTLGGSSIRTDYDQVNNFAIINVEPCGVKVGMRGLDWSGVVDFHEQEPGVFVDVDRQCDPVYATIDKALCAPPVGYGSSHLDQAMAMQATAGREVTQRTLMMVKALISESYQEFPNNHEELRYLGETAANCDIDSSFRTNLVDAVRNCSFIFQDGRFLKCYDSHDVDVDSGLSGEAIKLYNECLFAVCDANTVICEKVKSDIQHTACHLADPALATNTGLILGHDCTF